MHENLKPLGGIYTSVSPAFQRGLFEGGVRCLKSSVHDDGVVLEVKPEVIGGISEKNFGKQWRQGNRVYSGTKIATALESHPVGNAGGYTNLYSIEVKVKEATKQGYAIARGGAGQRQPYDARKPNKKRESRGRYGEHIRHKLQSRHICSDIGRPYCVCCLVSKEGVLCCDPQAHSKRVL